MAPPVQRGRSEGLFSGAFLLAIVGVVAVGAGVGVVSFLWRTPTNVPDPTEALVAAATGRFEPKAGAAPVSNDNPNVWTDADLKNCSAQASAASDLAAKRKLAAVSQDRVGLGGPDPQVIERATYLLCGATHKPLHLCGDYWRAWFMDAIKSHAAEFAAVSSSAYWNKVNLAEHAQNDAPSNEGKWKIISDDIDQTTREMGTMHAEITTAFRSLIGDGIIDPGDFGKFLGLGIPPDIGAMIGDAKPLRHLCG